MRAIVFMLFCSLCMADGLRAQMPVNKSYPEKYGFFYALLRLSEHRPRVAFRDSVKGLETDAIKAGDAELAGELKILYTVMVYRAGAQHNDTVENNLKEVIAAAAEKKLRYLQADALQRLGDYYVVDPHRQSKAIETYLAAYDV